MISSLVNAPQCVLALISGPDSGANTRTDAGAGENVDAYANAGAEGARTLTGNDLAELTGLAAAHGVPVVAVEAPLSPKSSVAPDGGAGPVQTPARDASMFDTVLENSIRNHGRSILVLAGRPSEGLVTFTALGALARGFDVVVVEDCCEGESFRVHLTAMQRLAQAGVVLTTQVQLRAEWRATQNSSPQQARGTDRRR